MNIRHRVFLPVAGLLVGCGGAPSFPELEEVAGTCSGHWSAEARPLGRVPDANLDGVADVLVTRSDSNSHRVELRSGRDGAVLWSHPVAQTPWRAALEDLDGDGTSELLVSLVQPHALEECDSNCDGSTEPPPHQLEMLSVADGSLRWHRDSESTLPMLNSTFAVLDDEDGDGTRELVLSAPFGLELDPSELRVISGATGAQLRTLNPPANGAESFGHALVRIPDLDGDGRADLLASDPMGPYDRYAKGRLVAISSGTGAVLWERTGDQVEGAILYGEGVATLSRPEGAFPDVLAGVHNGDSPDTEPVPGQLEVLDGMTGERRLLLAGRRGFEHFGLEVADVGDVNGDGVSDIGVGSPTPGLPVIMMGQGGRFSVHSGTDGAVLLDVEEKIPADKTSNFYGTRVIGLGDHNDQGKSTMVIEGSILRDGMRIPLTFAYRCQP